MFLSLTQQEFRLASYAGIDRFARALFGGRKNNYGLGHNAFDAHVIGAYGEIAVARATDHYWMADRGKPDHGAPDVGPYHVRTAPVPDRCLLLHKEDQDDEPFVLVVLHELPLLQIVGWCNGSDGKLSKYWREKNVREPCYFVPQSALQPLEVNA
jgi:hypothetical protein